MQIRDEPSERPQIEAEIVFLPPAEGGRRTLPEVGYAPHLVLQDREVRAAELNAIYMLGVRVLALPSDLALGEPGRLALELMYYPGVDYSRVVPGETFTVREGPRVVAHGVVLGRQDPD
jgi:hypothetical protein